MLQFIYSYLNKIKQKLVSRAAFIHLEIKSLVLLYFFSGVAALSAWVCFLGFIYQCLLYWLMPFAAFLILMLINLVVMTIIYSLTAKKSRRINAATQRFFVGLLR